MSIEKTTEDRVGQILDGESVQKTVRIPKKLLDALDDAAPKKWGAVARDGFTTKALCYFAARGLLAWEDEGNVKRRNP